MNQIIKENNSTVGIVSKKQPNTNYSIDENGVAYISQSEMAKMLFVSRDTIQRWIKKLKRSAGIKTNEFNQLDEEGFCKLLIYGRETGSQQASDLLDKIVIAGVRVFLYGMAEKQQPISIENKIAQLESNNEELKIELNQIKTLLLKNPEKINTHLRHEELTEWVNQGWLECDIKNSIIRKYSITNIGKQYLCQIKSHFELSND